MSETLDKISVHLEFLGYELEKLNPSEEKPAIVAKHSNYYNLIIIEFAKGFIEIQANALVNSDITPAMALFLNKANQKLYSKITCDTESENKTFIKFEVVYIGEYNKALFADLIDIFQKDHANITMLDNYSEVFNLK